MIQCPLPLTAHHLAKKKFVRKGNNLSLNILKQRFQSNKSRKKLTNYYKSVLPSGPLNKKTDKTSVRKRKTKKNENKWNVYLYEIVGN